MTKQFVCMICEKRFRELEEAELCELTHAAMKVVERNRKGRPHFAHCDKCDHYTLTSQLEPVLRCKATMSSPAEYEDWCETCRGVSQERDEAYERQAARDRADAFSRTGEKDWT